MDRPQRRLRSIVCDSAYKALLLTKRLVEDEYRAKRRAIALVFYGYETLRSMWFTEITSHVVYAKLHKM